MFPSASSLCTGAQLEPAQLSYWKGDAPGGTSGFAPQRSTTQTERPSLSIATPLNAPHLLWSAGKLPHGETERYGFGRSLVGVVSRFDTGCEMRPAQPAATAAIAASVRRVSASRRMGTSSPAMLRASAMPRRWRRENPVEAPWLASLHAPVAMADGDDDAVRSEDRVGAAKPACLAGHVRVGLRKPRTRLLVEEHQLTAFAVQVAGAAEVEECRDGFRADAPLLHAGPGLMGGGLHATTPGLRPPTGPARRHRSARSRRGPRARRGRASPAASRR